MPKDTPTSHYFDTTPGAPSTRRTIALTLPDVSVDLVVDRGVFSGERVDPGTRVLLLDTPVPSSSVADVLDLGCGYGPIAVTLAMRAPHAKVWAVDVNERAVDLTRENAQRLKLRNLTAVTPEAVPADVRFDLICSNPPVRVGKQRLHALLRTWLDRLRPEGHAYLVVQKHLGADSLQRWLVEEGWSAERRGSKTGYRLLEVTSGSRA